MPSIQFHRRYREAEPVKHFCEQWNVHLFNSQGEPETFRVSFKLNKKEIPSFDVALEGPTGAFVPLNKQHNYMRIKRVMEHLKDEFDDYKRNRNYQVKIT